MDWKTWDWNTIIIYIIVICILLFALIAEYRETNCADISAEICGPGQGRAYFNSRPLPGDTKEQLLEKINQTARYDLNGIHWRRVMIKAIIYAFIISWIVGRKFPKGHVLAIIIIIIFLIGYAFRIHYQESVVKPATEQVEDITKLL